jgi:hypothetical protein
MELGLGDTVEHDNAWLLSVICHVALREGWANTMRVAGRLAVDQWKKLGRPDEVERITAMGREALQP